MKIAINSNIFVWAIYYRERLSISFFFSEKKRLSHNPVEPTFRFHHSNLPTNWVLFDFVDHVTKRFS